MLIAWLILTTIFISYLMFALHKSDMLPHKKTAGFLGTMGLWFILSAVLAVVINYFQTI
ncbi:hypothetical protein THF1C08_320076 [Vibrio jasicida]|uniref:Uncharacterized protein n=1 Tax=Vibrio jasicida TaxID=766224 RepID=A0AAU9QPH3_9VIBR|nr:hypothetical protein THF1C08_320076 [Vibrio jasicida]CAH1597491.1 hypothetical protein THF1A12_320076 [Vibrio jasicida]